MKTKFPTRPEYRIIFLDEGGEYLQRTGFTSAAEALVHIEGIASSRKPQLVRVIHGEFDSLTIMDEDTDA